MAQNDENNSKKMLNDKDQMMLIELINKVVEHTNVTATSQALITENTEELSVAQERIEEKINYIYEILKKIDKSGLLKIFTVAKTIIVKFISRIFWGIIWLITLFFLKEHLLTLVKGFVKSLEG